MFAVSLHFSAYYEQCPHSCVVRTKKIELQHISFQCMNAVGMLRFCLHAFLILFVMLPASPVIFRCTKAVGMLRFCLHAFLSLFVVLPASPVIFYELRVCVNWLWPLFCFCVVHRGLHVYVCCFLLCYPLIFRSLRLVHVLQVHCAASIVLLHPCACSSLTRYPRCHDVVRCIQ